MILSKPSPSLEAGFTLTEVLVSIAITALMTSFLFSALQWGSKALVITEKAEANKRVILVQSLLRRSLENNHSKFEIGTSGQRTSLFVGEKNTLTYVSPQPADVMTAGLYRNQLSVTSTTPNTLALKSVLFRPLKDSNRNNPLNETEAYTLLENIKDLSISYYGQKDKQEIVTWHNTWNEQSLGPKLIRIEVTFPENDSRHWPTLTIKPF